MADITGTNAGNVYDPTKAEDPKYWAAVEKDLAKQTASRKAGSGEANARVVRNMLGSTPVDLSKLLK